MQNDFNLPINSSGPDGQFAQVRSDSVHNRFIHEVPEGHTFGCPASIQLTAYQECPEEDMISKTKES